MFCLRWHACAQALSGQLLPFCRCAVPAAKAAKEKRAAARFCAAARWSFLLFCQLFIQPCGDICKNLQLIGLQQQLVAGTGVEDAFNVQHTGVLQALDGAAHALALLAHRVGIAGEEEQRQNDRAVMDAYGFVKGTEARTSESACVAERMKLYQKLTETK